MFFASRVNPPQCSPPYAQCRELFLAGRTRQAHRLALQLSKSHGPQTAEDYMLCGDISLSSLRIHQYYATIKLGLKRFPQHRGLNILWGTILRSRSHIVEAITFLEDLVERSEGTDKILPEIILASVYAKAGFRQKPLIVFETQHNEQEDLYYYQYQKALTAVYLRDWHQAGACAEQCTQLAPKWLAARELLQEARLGCNDIAGAQNELKRMLQSGVEDAGMLLKAGFFFYSCNHLKHAVHVLEHLLTHWDHRPTKKTANSLLALIHWREGNFNAALQRAADCDEEFRQLFRNGRAGLKPSFRVMLPMPLTAQGHMMCVPVSVMMMAAVQGVKLNAEEIYKEAKGWAGTQLWRMSEILKKYGFTTCYVQAEPSVVMKLLRLGIPLMGETYGVFQNHVEVIHGFDRGLNIFYLRDPESWLPEYLPMEALAERYAANGGYLYVLVSEKNLERIQLAPHEFSGIGQQLFRLQRACALGLVEEAEKVYALLPPIDSILLTAAQLGSGVVCTEGEKQRLMDMIFRNDDLSPVLRMRALLSMAQFKPPSELLTELNRWKDLVGSYMSHLVLLMIDTMERKWEPVVEQADALLQRAYGHEIPWIYKSIALGELGRLKEAIEAIDNALDIAPHSLWAREIKNEFSKDRRPYQQRLTEINEAIEHLPDDHNLKWIRAGILLDGEDGLKYEEAEREYIALMPRDKQGYLRLARWYHNQERDDLVKTVLTLGRRYLKDELPDPEPLSAEAASPPPSANTVSTPHGVPHVPPEPNGHKRTPHSASPADHQKSEDPVIKLLARVARQCAASEWNQHPDTLEAMRETMTLLHQGELLWHQTAQLLYHRTITIYQNFETAHAAQELKRILPPKPTVLPGPPYLGLIGLLENLELLRLGGTEVVEVLQEWVLGQIPPHAALPPELTLQLAHFNQLLGQLNKAETMYTELTVQNPNMIEAFFHLGEIDYQKGKLKPALEKYEAVLELEPSHYGTLMRLADLSGDLNLPERRLHWNERTWRKYPYGYHQTLVYLLRAAEVKGTKEAESIRENVSHFHEPLIQAVLNFRIKRLYYYTSDLRKLLAAPPLTESKHPEVLDLHLTHHRGIGAYDTLMRVAADAMEAEPHNTTFMAYYAEALAHRSRKAAKEFYKTKLHQGYMETDFIDQFLNLAKGDLFDRSEELLTGAPEPLTSSLRDKILDAAMGWADPAEALRFIKTEFARSPQAPLLRFKLALHYYRNGLLIETYETLQPLLSQYPNDPFYLFWAARAVKTTAPQDALLLIERAYRLSDDASTCLESADIHQLLDHKEDAKRIYRQLLRYNPYDGNAVINLLRLGEPAADYLDQLFVLVERPASIHIALLHLTTLQTAIDQNKEVPKGWIDTACARFRKIMTEDQCKQEKLMLGLAIAHWFKVKNEPKAERFFRKHCGNMIDKIKMGDVWNKTYWVPWG